MTLIMCWLDWLRKQWGPLEDPPPKKTGPLFRGRHDEEHWDLIDPPTDVCPPKINGEKGEKTE